MFVFCTFFIFLTSTLSLSMAQLCPPIFGETECPVDYECNFGVCKNSANQSPPENCGEIKCSPETICLLGRCYPIEGFPCRRNILVGEKTAYSIVSDCGHRGKCVNGKCVTDKCYDIVCDEGHFCRDGKCHKYLGNFCFSDYDCGPLSVQTPTQTELHCLSNKCELRNNTHIQLSSPALKCNPGEILQGENCVTQEGCAQIVCEISESCLNGFCVPTAFECGESSTGEATTCPDQMICKNRVCIRNPCINRCPIDHACINNGECRLIQGLPCTENCVPPFECVNGVCMKDECRYKVCQIGERCEGGFCVRIDGRQCKTSERDCGDAFECIDSKCQDKILLRTLDNFFTKSNSKSIFKRIRS